MEYFKDIGHQITARKLMHNILYDNGCINIFEPDSLKRYPKKHFDKITNSCELFFDKYPQFLTEEDLENIAYGCQDDNELKYGIYPEYQQLNEDLNNYFEII